MKATTVANKKRKAIEGEEDDGDQQLHASPKHNAIRKLAKRARTTLSSSSVKDESKLIQNNKAQKSKSKK